MGMKLYVGNLSFEASETDLQELFAQAGQVESARIITDMYTGKSRGFGFVEMANRDEGQKAIDQFNGKDLKGRPIVVSEPKPRGPPRRRREGDAGRPAPDTRSPRRSSVRTARPCLRSSPATRRPDGFPRP
jgi:RNA recognition motif-containing protein